VGNSTGVLGKSGSASGYGVMGGATGQNGVGVRAESAGHGVFATTSGQYAAGVYGIGIQGYGVLGNATTGIGVAGRASGGSFAVGETQHTIAGVKLTAKSGVVATLNTTAGAGIYLTRARVNLADSKIVLILSGAATSAAQYTYFIVDTP